MDSTSLITMDKTTMLARINQVKFPQDLSPAEKGLLSEAAITYGFDPIMSEISIFQGKPFVSIDGRYRKAQESGLLDGVESRPATKQEREDWSIPVEDFFFRADVYVKGASRPFVGWGRVFGTETKPGSRNDPNSKYKPTQSNPQRMAEKRAEAQALRKAFHIPLPSIEDIGLPEYDIEGTTVEPAQITDKKPEPAKTPAPVVDNKQEAPPPPPTQVLHPEAADTRGEFEKEGKDMLTEAIDEVAVAPAPTPAAVSAEAPSEAPAEATKSPIDLVWLREQLGILQGKKLEGWTNSGIVGKIQAITGKDTKTVSAAVMNLTTEQAALFVEKIQSTIEMS